LGRVWNLDIFSYNTGPWGLQSKDTIGKGARPGIRWYRQHERSWDQVRNSWKRHLG
jgi:hypothetical protein